MVKLTYYKLALKKSYMKINEPTSHDMKNRSKKDISQMVKIIRLKISAKGGGK